MYQASCVRYQTLDEVGHNFWLRRRRIANDLVSNGGILIVPPEGFFVEGKEGPFDAGELERAADWVKEIIVAFGGRHHGLVA